MDIYTLNFTSSFKVYHLKKKKIMKYPPLLKSHYDCSDKERPVLPLLVLWRKKLPGKPSAESLTFWAANACPP